VSQSTSVSRAYGWSIVVAVRLVPTDWPTLRQMHRKGPYALTTLRRAAKRIRGFVRIEGEFPYTKAEWEGTFGVGTEHGKHR
jgi:hypothetical protein